ncbi:Aste57867_16309 [Aphanomyces stellatus]|uniref:Aste57867_16309 protein n=1 Tax=Aphanomyces stellatus TaxID=120398 RepID=A0A485L648_9STRA|nr:hypothetical protein As57867_016252 [Aphanomyces stellatus]VFT93085.1 Aste57867_16309 [Aphanomyces stellatus]
MRTTTLFIVAAAVAAAQAPANFNVSVVGDATYNIAGPICSGSGPVPAGIKCPIKGDIAVESCLKYLPSFTGGKCVAPVNAVCQMIPSGAWGCVWSNATNATNSIVFPTNSTSKLSANNNIVFPANTTKSNATNTIVFPANATKFNATKTNVTTTNATRVTVVSNDTITAPPTTVKP